MACKSDSGTPPLMADHPAAKGLAAMRSGDFAAALAHFESLIAQEPTGVAGHFLRAEALEKSGDRAQARSAMLELVTRFPFAEAACQERLALLALSESDVPAALQALSRAADLGWCNPAALSGHPEYGRIASHPALAPILEKAYRNAQAADE